MKRARVFTLILISSVFAGFVICTVPISNEVGAPEIDARFISMKNCSKDNQYKLFYKDVTIEKKNKTCYTLKAKIQLLEDIPGPIKIVNKIDSCGKDITQFEKNRAWFTDYITEDACAELEQQKGQLYKTFKAVNMSHIRCPLPKNVYKLPPVDIKMPDEAKSLVIKAHYWDVNSTMYHNDDIITCFNIRIEIKPKERERKRKGKK